MLPILPNVGVDLSAVVTSDAVIVGVAQVVTVQGGTLIVNGLPVSSPYSLTAGDALSVRVTASPAYSTSAYASLTSSVDLDTSVYLVTTKADPNWILHPIFAGIPVLDIQTSYNGDPYVPSTVGDSYGVYSPEGVLQSTINLQAAPLGSGTDSSYYVVLDHHTKTVYVFSTSNVLLGKRTYGEKIYGGTVTRNSSDPSDSTLFWVSIPSLNKVVGLDSNLVEVRSYTLGNRPLGIASVNPGALNSLLLVGSTGDNSLLVVESNSGSLLRTIPLPGRPLEIVTYGSTALVTLSDIPAVALVNLTTFVVTTVALPAIPSGITYDTSFMYVCCVNKVVRVNLGSLALTTVTVPEAFFNEAVIQGNSLYVTDLNLSKVHEVSLATFTLGASFTVPGKPYGILSTGNNLVVGSFYQNTPQLLFNPDTVPSAFDLVDPPKVPRNFSLGTDVVTVQGVLEGFPIPVSIPNLYSAYIKKNGVAVGQATTAVLGDTLQVFLTTPPTQGVHIVLPLSVGTVFNTFESITASVDATPDEFEFIDLSGQALSTPLTSNAVTLVGVDPDAVIGITASPSTAVLYRNGVSLGANYGVYSLNDTLSVRMTSPGVNCDVQFVTITAGDYSTIWSIVTAVRPGYFLQEQYLTIPTPSLPTLGAPNTTGDSLAVTSLGLSGVTRTSLGSPPTGIVEQIEYLTVVDPAKRTVYLVHPTTKVVAKSYTPGGTESLISADYFPKVSLVVGTPTRIVLALGGTSNRLVVLDSNLDLLSEIALPSAPSAILSSTNSVVLVAFKAIGQVERYSVQGSTLIFLDSLSTLSPDFLGEDPTSNNLFVGSSTRKSLEIFDPALQPVASLASIVCVSLVTDISDGRTFIADTYTNSVRVLGTTYLEQSPILLSGPPTGITQDGSKLFVSLLRPSSILKIDVATTVVESTLALAPTVQDVYVSGLDVVALESTANVDLTATTSLLTSMGSVSVPFTDGVPVGSVASSPVLTVSGLVRPSMFYAEPYPGVAILRNGIDVGSVSPVANGDTLVVTQVAPSTYYTHRDLRMGSCSSSSLFSIRTEPDLLPDEVSFLTVYDQRVGLVAESNTVTIAGITPGFSTVLTVDFGNAIGAVYLNGEIFFTDELTVTNGDTLKLALLVEGPYGTLRLYPVLRLTTSLGSFKVVTITLEGAELWPVFAPVRTSASPTLLEKDHYLVEGFPQVATLQNYSRKSLGLPEVTKAFESPTSLSFNRDGSQVPHPPIFFSNMADGADLRRSIVVGGTTLGSAGNGIDLKKTLYVSDGLPEGTRPEANALFGVALLQAVVQEMVYVVEGAPPPVPYQYEGISRYWSPLTGWANTGWARKGGQSRMSTLVYDLLTTQRPPTRRTETTWRTYSQEFQKNLAYGVLTRDQFFARDPYEGIYFSPLVYLRDLPQDLKVLEPIFIKDTLVQEIYFELLVARLDARPILADAFPWEIIETSLTLTDIQDPEAIKYAYGVGLVNSYPLLDVPWVRSLEVETPVHLPASSYASGHSQHVRGVEVATAYMMLSQVAANVLQRVLDSYQAELVQDEVTYCPPYGTCGLTGLYPTLAEAFAAAQDASPGGLVEAVPFKSCFLWKRDPVLSIKACASVGPNDLFIIPYAWALSQGPLKIARTQLKVGRYLHGG